MIVDEEKWEWVKGMLEKEEEGGGGGFSLGDGRVQCS